jgi:hypothetical protein
VVTEDLKALRLGDLLAPGRQRAGGDLVDAAEQGLAGTLAEGLPAKHGGCVTLGEQGLLLAQRVFRVDLPQPEPTAHPSGGHDRDICDIVLGGSIQGMELQAAVCFVRILRSVIARSPAS